MKIGVTFGVEDHDEHPHVTGILQNVVNLTTCLRHDHDVTMLNTVKGVDCTQKFSFNVYDYPVDSYHAIIAEDKFDYDLLLVLGGEIHDKDLEWFEDRPTKVVYYNCGAKYQTHIIDILFERTADHPFHRSMHPNYDDVWTIPQNYKISHYFINTLHKVNCKAIPFLYDPKFIDAGLDSIGYSYDDAAYEPSNIPKRVSIMEPNRDWLKAFTYPTLIAETVYRREPDLISQLSINNLKVYKDNPNLVAFFESCDVWENDTVKAYINDWFPVYEYLKDYTDVVVSHNWGNPLNYYYLDVMYLRYPIIHNADMCKDAGYYYEDWNFEMAEDKLIEALKFHDDNLELYDYQVERILDRFSPNNEKTINIYNKLINNLMEN